MLDDQNINPAVPTTTNPLDVLSAQTPPATPAIDPTAQADLNQALVGLGAAPATEPVVTIESPLDARDNPPIVDPIASVMPAITPVSITEHPIEETGPHPTPGSDYHAAIADHSPIAPIASPEPIATTPPVSPIAADMPTQPTGNTDQKALEEKAKEILSETPPGSAPPKKPSFKKIGAIGGSLVALALVIGGTLAATGLVQMPGVGENRSDASEGVGSPGQGEHCIKTCHFSIPADQCNVYSGADCSSAEPGNCEQIDVCDNDLVNGKEVCRVHKLGSCDGNPPDNPDDPTPKPELDKLICKELKQKTNSEEAPKLNDQVTFTCEGVFNNDGDLQSKKIEVTEFRYKVNNGEWQSLAASGGEPGGGNKAHKMESSPLTVNQIGTYVVQCRVCRDLDSGKCSPWEADTKKNWKKPRKQ